MLFFSTFNSKLGQLHTRKAYWTYLQYHDNYDKINIPYAVQYKIQHFWQCKIAGPRGASREAPEEPPRNPRGALKKGDTNGAYQGGSHTIVYRLS